MDLNTLCSVCFSSCQNKLANYNWVDLFILSCWVVVQILFCGCLCMCVRFVHICIFPKISADLETADGSTVAQSQRWHCLFPPQMWLRHRHTQPDNQLEEYAGCELEGLCFYRVVCLTALSLYHSVVWECRLSHFVTGRLGVSLQATHIDTTLRCSTGANIVQCFPVCLWSKNIWFILFFCLTAHRFSALDALYSSALLFIHDSDSYGNIPLKWLSRIMCCLRVNRAYCSPPVTLRFFFLFFLPW